MNETLAVSDIEQNLLAGGAVGCPICWDHDVEKLESVQLYRGVVYHCPSWHVFAVFEHES